MSYAPRCQTSRAKLFGGVGRRFPLPLHAEGTGKPFQRTTSNVILSRRTIGFALLLGVSQLPYLLQRAISFPCENCRTDALASSCPKRLDHQEQSVLRDQDATLSSRAPVYRGNRFLLRVPKLPCTSRVHVLLPPGEHASVDSKHCASVFLRESVDSSDQRFWMLHALDVWQSTFGELQPSALDSERSGDAGPLGL